MDVTLGRLGSLMLLGRALLVAQAGAFDWLAGSSAPSLHLGVAASVRSY